MLKHESVALPRRWTLLLFVLAATFEVTLQKTTHNPKHPKDHRKHTTAQPIAVKQGSTQPNLGGPQPNNAGLQPTMQPTTAQPNGDGANRTPTQPSDESYKACCRFGLGPCRYKFGGGPRSGKIKIINEFEKIARKDYMNPATGVPSSKDGKYMAAYLKQNQTAYMEAETNFPARRTIKFNEYKATENLRLKACCETEIDGCRYDTGPKTDRFDYRQWYAAQIECPAGTRRVIFYAENFGENEGGVGIDNISVLDENMKKIC